jgi:hypothetical protein
MDWVIRQDTLASYHLAPWWLSWRDVGVEEAARRPGLGEPAGEVQQAVDPQHEDEDAHADLPRRGVSSGFRHTL